ncbi:hypothetical protein [Streptomyces sp. NPDC054784]
MKDIKIKNKAGADVVVTCVAAAEDLPFLGNDIPYSVTCHGCNEETPAPPFKADAMAWARNHAKACEFTSA